MFSGIPDSDWSIAVLSHHIFQWTVCYIFELCSWQHKFSQINLQSLSIWTYQVRRANCCRSCRSAIYIQIERDSLFIYIYIYIYMVRNLQSIIVYTHIILIIIIYMLLFLIFCFHFKASNLVFAIFISYVLLLLLFIWHSFYFIFIFRYSIRRKL